MDVVRVLVNQAHTFGNGGGFDNGLPFTLSMGCGTWAGNTITENLNLSALHQHHASGDIDPGGQTAEEADLFGSTGRNTAGMNFEEYAAKPLLSAAGIAVPRRQALPRGRSRREATAADRPVRGQGAGADRQARQGGRHQARGDARRSELRTPANPRHDHRRARRRRSAGRCAGAIAREMYAAILNDPGIPGADAAVLAGRRHGYRGDRRRSSRRDAADARSISVTALDAELLARVGRAARIAAAAETRSPSILVKLYDAYRASDAELIEINPLVRDARRAVGGARLQVHGRRQRAAAPGRARAQAASPDKTDRARSARQGAASQVHRARRQRRRAGQRRRPHHDDHGRDRALSAARPRISWRSAATAYTKASPALEIVLANPKCQVAARQLLRRLRAHRRDGRRRASRPGWQLKPTSRSSSRSTAPARTRRSRWSASDSASSPTT